MADLSQQNVARLNFPALHFVGSRDLCSQLVVVLALCRGMLVGLFGEFMRGQVICFVVRSNSGGMSVFRKAAEFCGSIVRTLWHSLPSWI
jgi:hypothetical protein